MTAAAATEPDQDPATLAPRKNSETPHTWPCHCPYCAAIVIADDGPDVWDEY